MAAAPMTWHQRAKKVLVTCEIPNLKDLVVTITEKSFNFAGKAGDKVYSMEVPLAHDVVVEESRWFVNDRAASIILAKKDDSCFWDKISTDAGLKRIVKPNLIEWLEEDDDGYNGLGPVEPEDDGRGGGGMGGMMGGMGGMGGGMGGMDLSALMGGMGGGGGGGSPDMAELMAKLGGGGGGGFGMGGGGGDEDYDDEGDEDDEEGEGDDMPPLEDATATSKPSTESFEAVD